MYNKKPLKIIFIILIAIFIGWISLCGEYLQDKYKDFTFWGLAFLLLVSIIYKLPERFSGVDFVFFLYIFLITWGLNFCEDKTAALHYYALLILPLPLLYFSMHSKDKGVILPLAWILFLCGLAIALIGMLELIFRKNIIYELWVNNYFYQRFIYGTPRIMSTQMHPTAFGSFLLGCLPFSYFLLSQVAKPYKILIGLMTIIIILGIILSFSRGNILGLTMLSIVYLVLKKKIRYVKYVIIGVLLLIIFSSTILIYKLNFIRFSVGTLSSGWWISEKEKGAIALKMLQDHPFMGVGLKHYHLIFDRYSSDSYKKIEQGIIERGNDTKEWKTADNTYFSMLAEQGLFGSLSFILFLILLFRKKIAIMKKLKFQRDKEFIAANISAIVGLSVSMNTYDLFYWITTSLLFWFLVGSLRGVKFDA